MVYDRIPGVDSAGNFPPEVRNALINSPEVRNALLDSPEIGDAFEENTMRIKALEAMNGVTPETPVDGQTADLIAQTGTLTRSALESAIGDVLLTVAHGDDAYHPRPDTLRRVLWLGTTVPYYRRAGDIIPEVVSIPGPWTPEMLDLVAWYDPTNGYQSGTVSRITDRGPLNLHMTIGGTGGISMDTNALELPAFANSGTAFVTSPLLPDGAWDHPVTVYMIVSLSTMQSVSSLLDNGPGASTTRVAIWATSNGVLGFNQGASASSTANVIPANTPVLVAVTFSGGPNTYAEVEGDLVVGPVDAGSNKLGSVRLFANGAGNNIADAVIGDVVIARNVSHEQHVDTVAWLRERWGMVPRPTPWTPKMLDLVAWYDPANGYKSGVVPQITDRGPHSMHMEIGGTGEFSIDTNTFELPAFSNAGTAFATSPLLPDGAWDHPVTVYMVASLSTMQSVSSLLDNGPGPSNTRVAIWATADGVVGLTQGISASSKSNVILANTPFLVAVTFSVGSNTYAEVDGSVVIDPTDAGFNKLGSIRLFANGADERIADAVMGDLIIARNVTPEQHADTVAWLQDKWGLV